MREAAHVTSLEALARFRAAWADFGDAARLALSGAEHDVQKTMWWLQNQQRQHWQMQIKKREKKLAEARAELHSAQTASRDQRPSLVLERKRFEKAKRELEEAQTKLERVKYWTRVLEREYMLYKGQTQGLATRIERDVPHGLARLANQMDRLEAYIRTGTPLDSSAGDAGDGSGETPGEDAP
jgi:chromosome segregation ATPase